MKTNKSTRQQKIDRYLKQFKRLTKTQQQAIEAIGSHRKTKCPVGQGKKVSTRTYKALEKKGLVMPLKFGNPMLTARGEYLYTSLHPNSKYRIF